MRANILSRAAAYLFFFLFFFSAAHISRPDKSTRLALSYARARARSGITSEKAGNLPFSHVAERFRAKERPNGTLVAEHNASLCVRVRRAREARTRVRNINRRSLCRPRLIYRFRLRVPVASRVVSKY